MLVNATDLLHSIYSSSHWCASSCLNVLTSGSGTSVSPEIGLFVWILGDLLSPNLIDSFTCWLFPSHLLHCSIIDGLDCRLVHLLCIIALLYHIRHLIDSPFGFPGRVACTAWRTVVPMHDFASLLVVRQVFCLSLHRSLWFFIFKRHDALFRDLALYDLEYLVGRPSLDLSCTAVAPVIWSFLLWSVLQLERLDDVLLELFARLLLWTRVFTGNSPLSWPHQVERVVHRLKLLYFQFCLHHDDDIFFYFN